MDSIRRGTAGLVCLILLFQPAVALAGPVAAKSGGPGIEQTANGLPLVQINRPNTGGVSHNRYQRFDIDRQGLILNNARTIASTQLAGYIDGNPNLTHGTARIILNEVTGNQRSFLHGFAEVAGDRAEVVIANPNGTTCDGCGFLNTSRALITTGLPEFNSSGGLDKLQIRGGDISVEGDGLQASDLQVDLLARSIRVNGAIHAGDLSLITGSNRIDYATLGIENLTGDGAAPQLAIDVGQLGGMYAGRIRLIGTEAGLGVVSYGEIAASGDRLTINNNGQLQLAGHLQSGGKLVISSDGLEQSGDLYATGRLSVKNTGALISTGILGSGGDLTIKTDELQLSGTLAAGITADGQPAAAADLTVTATGQAEISGHIYAGGDLDIQSQSLALKAADVFATGSASLNSTDQLDLDSSSEVTSGQTTTIQANQLTNAGILQAGENLNLELSGAVSSNGLLLAGDALRLKAQGLDNNNGQILGTTIDVILSGELTNQTGLMQADDQLLISAAGLDNRQGMILAAGPLEIATSLALDNREGLLFSQEELLLTGGSDLNNRDGFISAHENLSIEGAVLENQSGLLASDGNLDLQGQELRGSGTLLAGDTASIFLTGDYLHAADSLIQAGRLDLEVDGALSNFGNIVAAGEMNIAGRQITNQTDALIQAGQLQLTASEFIENNGRLEGDELQATTVSLTNVGTLLGNRLRLITETLDNRGSSAVIAATEQIELWTRELRNSDQATIFSLGDLSIAGPDGSSAARSILNEGSLIEAGRDLDINAERIDNRRADIEITTDLIQNTSKTLGLYPGYQQVVLVEDCSMAGDSNDCVFVPGYETRFGEKVETVAVGDILTHDPEQKYVEFVGLVAGIEQQTSCSTDPEMIETCVTRNILVDKPQLITAWYDSYEPSGGQVSISYYPDYDPQQDLHPEALLHVVLEAKGEPVGHDETSRTVTTRVWRDRFSLVSPEPQMLAGRNLTLAVNDRLLNKAGQISAGQDLTINGASFQAGEVSDANIVNRSFDLLQKRQVDIVSIVEWHDSCGLFESHCGDNVVAYPWVPLQLVKVIDSLTGSIQAGRNLSIYTGSLENTAVTATDNPLTGSTAGNLFQTDLPAPPAADDLLLTIPNNGLYHPNPDPDSQYLVETDPRFANYGQFLSSDYMLERLGLDPAVTLKRLGDGFYEQRLVMTQLAEAPRPANADWMTDAARFQQLMDEGIAAAEQLDLSAGVALTEAQVAALSHDIVWLVEQQVQLEDGRSEQVLVPVLYLARLQPGDLQPSGVLMAGGSMEIFALEDIKNSGSMIAAKGLLIDAADLSNSGIIQSSGDLALNAVRDIRNISGEIIGENVALSAGRNIELKTQTREIFTALDNTLAGNTLIGQTASVKAAAGLSMWAGKDLHLRGAEVSSGGDTQMTAGHVLQIDTVTTRESLQHQSDILNYDREDLRHLQSRVEAGGNLGLASGGDLQLNAANIEAGADLTLVAAGNIHIAAATDSSKEELTGQGDKSQIETRRLDEAVRSSQLNAGGNLIIASAATSDDAVAISGSTLSAGATGTLQITSAGGIQITEARERHESYYHKEKEGGSLLTKKSSMIEIDETADLAVGSGLAGGDILISGDRGVLLQGSSAVGARSVGLQSTQGDVTLTAAEELHNSSYQQKTDKVFSKKSEITHDYAKELVGSTVTAEQNLTIIAGTNADGSIGIYGSQLQSGDTIDLRAGSEQTQGNIELIAGASETLAFAEKKKSGIGLWASGDSVSFYRASKQQDSALQQHSEASTITAGGDITAVASRDINLLGSQISGDDVMLASGRDINLLHDQDHLAEEHVEQKSDFGFSVSTDQNSLSFFAGLEKNRVESELSQERVSSSEIHARGDVSIVSGASIVQVGSDITAGGDIQLVATDEIRTLVGYNIRDAHYLQESMRVGFTSRLQHNLGNARDQISNAMESENIITGASRTLRVIDAVDNVTQPSLSTHIGVSGSKVETSEHSELARVSTISAGNDLALSAGDNILGQGTLLSSGRDILITADTIKWQATQNTETFASSQKNYQAGFTAQGSEQSATMAVGGNGSKSTSDSTSSAASGGQLNAGRDITLMATQDIELEAIRADAGRNILLDANRHLRITAGQGHGDSSTDSSNFGAEAGIGFGTTGTGPGLGVYGSINGGQQTIDRENSSHVDSHLVAQQTLQLQVGQDVELRGASLEADHIKAEIGGNLTIASSIDTGKTDGDQSSASLTIGTGGLGLSGGLGNTDGDKNWIEQQTTIRGHEEVNILVADHTQLDHAMVVADNGNLYLETDTFSHSDFLGEDTETSSYLGGGISVGVGRPSTGDTAGSNELEPNLGNWNVEGSYSEKDRRQTVLATIGAGEIIVRADQNTGVDSTTDLNRDETKAYEITQDESSDYELYASENSVKNLDLPEHITTAIEYYAEQAERLIDRLFPEGLTAKQKQDFHQASLSNNPERLNALIADFKQRGLTDSELEAIRDYVHRNIDGLQMIASLSEESKQKALLQVGIFIDGTGNDKYRDAPLGAETNVARLSEIYDGDKKKYFSGVGSTNLWDKIVGGVSGYGSQGKITEAIQYLSESYSDGAESGPKILVIDSSGFSRGAAAIRSLTNQIISEGIPGISNELIFTRSLMIFDTVASIGIPGNKIDVGYDYSIPNDVGIVFHIVAENEYRDSFDLQSTIYADGTSPFNVIEIGFPGSHSDIGGGYTPGEQDKRNEFSLIPLEWMHSQATSYGIPIQAIPENYLPPSDLLKLYNDYRLAQNIHRTNSVAINEEKFSLAFSSLEKDFIHNNLPFWKKIPGINDTHRTTYYLDPQDRK